MTQKTSRANFGIELVDINVLKSVDDIVNSGGKSEGGVG
jgi:hypothetical protein